jgi:hypothetical protein
LLDNSDRHSAEIPVVEELGSKLTSKSLQRESSRSSDQSRSQQASQGSQESDGDDETTHSWSENSPEMVERLKSRSRVGDKDDYSTGDSASSSSSTCSSGDIVADAEHDVLRAEAEAARAVVG